MESSDIEDDFEIVDPTPKPKVLSTSSGSVGYKGDLKRTVRLSFYNSFTLIGLPAC